MELGATDHPLDLARRPPGLLAHNPAWRWQQAIELAYEHQTIPESVEQADPILAAAARLQHALIRERRLGGYGTGLKAEFGDLYTAFDIWSSPMLFEQRWILEAFLLVGTPQEDIARYANQPVGVVKLFEDLFFDIRPFLKYPLLMMALFIDPLRRDLDRPEREVRLKSVALAGGADMLARFLRPEPRFTPEQTELLVRILGNIVKLRQFQRALDGTF